MAKLKITLKKSLIGRPETQRKTVRSLGLRKINSFQCCRTIRQFADRFTKLNISSQLKKLQSNWRFIRHEYKIA